MNATRWWPQIRSVVAWWVLVTAALWGLGKAFDQPMYLWGCAASAALFVGLGEAGDWVRRRYTSRRTRRHQRAAS